MGTILSVEDNEFTRKVIRQTLEKEGHTVLMASNGQEGLDLLKANPEVGLVFTDINMPVMDGLAMTREIRKTNPTLPIITLTSEAEANRKQEGKDAGATGWLVKPIDPERMLLVVKKVLG